MSSISSNSFGFQPVLSQSLARRHRSRGIGNGVTRHAAASDRSLQGNYGNSLAQMMAQMMQQMMTLMSSYATQVNPNYETVPAQTPTTTTDTSTTNNTADTTTTDNSTTTTSNCEPTPPPPPPVYCPPPPPPVCPPPPTPTYLKGSAGLVGDPKFMLFTPELQNVADLAPLKSFESGLQNGQTITALHDNDNGGLQINLTGTQVDPSNGNTVGVGEAQFWVGQQSVIIKNNGDLLVDDVKKANINDSGFVAPIQLATGATIGTANRIDDAAGNQKERFVLNNGEYEVTAALRSPHPDSANYLDMNFAEVTSQAADNATGYQVPVSGIGNVGLADLLRLEVTA